MLAISEKFKTIAAKSTIIKKLRGKQWIKDDGIDIDFENIVLWDSTHHFFHNMKADGVSPFVFVTGNAKLFDLSIEEAIIDDPMYIYRCRHPQALTQVDLQNFSKEVFDVEFSISDFKRRQAEGLDCFYYEETKDEYEKNFSNPATLEEKTQEAFDLQSSLVEHIHSDLKSSKDEDVLTLAAIKAANAKSRKLSSAIEDEISHQTNANDDLINYKHKDLPLATDELINELQAKHVILFSLISSIQESHAPNDFSTSYHIQDRIAYLLENKTLLYKSLVIQLISLLERIISKLSAYQKEITIKQQELKKMNEQVSIFKEYSRKTEEKIQDVIEEGAFLNEDVAKIEAEKQNL